MGLIKRAIKKRANPSFASSSPPSSPKEKEKEKVIIDHEDVRARIKQIPIFQEIKDDERAIDQIANICDAVQIEKDKTIIEEGSLGSEMYILHSGEVEIRKITRAGDQYTVVQLHANLNVFFGELALIDNDRRSASVTAKTDSTVLKISKKDFGALGIESPHIALPIIVSIARILGGRLRKTTTDMLTIFDALVQELSE